MAQQINLCTPIQLAPTQRFAARSMALSLLIVMVVGGLMAGALVWSLQRSAAAYQQTLDMQERDIQGLKTALEAARASAAPVDPALMQQLLAKRQEVKQRELLLEAVRDGAFKPGSGHSDRLQLLAKTIPAKVWIRSVNADAQHLEIGGFTLEPAALNEWVTRLSQSPLLEGLQLTTVQVDNTAMSDTKSALADPAAPSSRAVWSFTLITERPAPSTPAPLAASKGSQP